MRFRTGSRPLLVVLAAGCLLLEAAAALGLDLDLTAAGASGSIGAGTFQQTSPQPTGTGVIDPFVRIQANGDQQGFNTNHSPLIGDLADVKAGTWTHPVPVAALSPQDFGAGPSVRFLLDINQTSADPLLSLEQLKVFTAPIPNHSSKAALFAENLVYDMGAGNRILLDYSLNTGSGSGDMYFDLPYALFAGLGTQYLYLYSEFGTSGGDYMSNAGFEEWAHIVFPLPVEDRTWSEVKHLYH